MHHRLRMLTIVSITLLFPMFYYGLSPTYSFRSVIGNTECDTTPYYYAPLPGEPDTLRFAVIGDYGNASEQAADVASLVDSWQPDFVVTTGDNNYDNGTAETIDDNIGQFYEQFIGNYQGDYGDGAAVNRFFPVLGNHDLHTSDGAPYHAYLALPGNERYYDFVWGDVHFFALNSNPHEPDGSALDSEQAQWLHDKLASSPEKFNVVYMHHPPYSSGMHGSQEKMQWPFAEWGADVVLAGHDHDYERIVHDGIPYFVNGLGGAEIRYFPLRLSDVDGSEVRYNCDYGAMLVEVQENTMTFRFITRDGLIVDQYTISA